MSSKKPRASNLSYVEKVILVDLCVKYKEVIENKRTDALSARAKEDGWRQLADEFLASSGDGVKREWQQLKNVRCLDRPVVTERCDYAPNFGGGFSVKRLCPQIMGSFFRKIAMPPNLHYLGSRPVVFMWLWRSLWRWGLGMGLAPSPEYSYKVILSPPNTPFLLPVQIIYHTFITTNYYTSKVFLIFMTNIVFGQFCVGIVLKACSV